jgi:hypothetical protein
MSKKLNVEKSLSSYQKVAGFLDEHRSDYAARVAEKH